MKKVLALILVLLMACSLFAACGSSSSTSSASSASSDVPALSSDKQENVNTFIEAAQTESKAEDVQDVTRDQPIKVTVALSNSCTQYTPIMNVNPYNNIIANGVYERLAQREQYGASDLTGVLLKSWTQVDDYTYDCELYDYIYDSDGNNLKASDVVYCMQIQAEEASKTTAKKVKSCEATGDYTFTITVGECYAGYWTEFCESMYIVTEAAYEKSKADNSICAGTGPYVCTEFLSNSYIVCEKRDDYWQTEELTVVCSRANVDVIRYNIVSEVTQMAIAIDSPDETQMCAYIVESLTDDAMNNTAKTGVEVTSIRNNQTKIFCFNASEHSVLNNADLRRAICYAINNEACIAATYAGIGYIPDTLGVPDLLDWKDEWAEGEYYPYDPARAAEYLEKAGYNPDNANISITFMANQNTQNETNGSFLAGCLSAFGINCEVTLVESAASTTYRNDPNSGWDVFEMGQTPSNIYNYLYYASYGDQGMHGGMAAWGEVSDDLQALVEKVKTGDEEAYEEYRNYIIDEALMYQYAGCYFTVTHVGEISNIVTDYRNSLCVGACTFDADYAYYAD